MRWRGPVRSYGAKPPVARLRCTIRPATRASDPPEAPASRLFLRSGVSPGLVTVSGEAFLLPAGYPAQEFAASILRIFWPSTCCPQKRQGYPRHRLFLHRIVHISSTAEDRPPIVNRGRAGYPVGGPAVSRSRTWSIRSPASCGISQRVSSHQVHPASAHGVTAATAAA
jgi:hypothetical protein